MNIQRLIGSSFEKRIFCIWQELEKRQITRGDVCNKVGGCDGYCCRFAESGLQPTVSKLEWDMITSFFSNSDKQIPPARGDICPFLNLETQKCTIYEVRPIECRVYFCGLTDKDHIEFQDIWKQFYKISREYNQENPIFILEWWQKNSFQQRIM